MVAFGHDCDLAVLEVKDEAFWQGIQLLKLGNLPDLQAPVQVVGYPTGGDTISITKGVISRIEPQYYSYSAGAGAPLLAIQVPRSIRGRLRRYSH